MTPFSKRVCLLATLLTSLCAVVRAEEPQWPKRNLQFEVRESRPLPPGPPKTVTHRADIVVGPKESLWVRFHNLELNLDLFRMPAAQSMSEKQRALPGWASLAMGGNDSANPGSVRVQLFAVSENDARKMAQAFVELCDSKTRAQWEKTTKDLDDARKAIPETDKKIPELEAKIKTESAECDELRKTVSYRNLDDAAQDVLDLDKMLRSVQLEVAGIQAKQEAIQKIINRFSGKPPQGLDFHQMMATQDIELAGALARKSALEAHRKNADRYCTLSRQKESDMHERDELRERLKNLRDLVPWCEKLLADPPTSMTPLTVLDNKVLIYPVGDSKIGRPGVPGSVKPGAPSTRPAATGGL